MQTSSKLLPERSSAADFSMSRAISGPADSVSTTKMRREGFCSSQRFFAASAALQLPERLLVMVNASTSPLSPKADSQSAMFGQALKVRPFVPRSVVTIASTSSAASSRNSSTAVRTVSGTLTKSTPSMVSRSQLESAAMRI